MARPGLGLRVVLATLLALAALQPAPAVAQQSGRAARPAFVDSAARRLVTGALLQSRVRVEEGEVRAVVQSRARAGFLIPGQSTWRVRTLFHKESLGVSLATMSGGRQELVLARDRGSPVIGDDLMERDPLWGTVGFDPEPDDPALLGVLGLSLGTVAPDMPGGAALGVYQAFDSTFIDPLGALGPDIYSYATGRDLVVDGQTLRGVEFRPRDPAAGELTGILWFDRETGAPTRAMVRPRGRWPLRGGLRGFARGLPFVPKQAEGSVEYVTMSYAEGDDGSSWPDKAHLHGTVSMFWGQTLIPVQFDWNLDWDATALTATEGAVPAPILGGWRISTVHDSLVPYIRELDRVVGQPPAPSPGQVVTQTLGSLRFNQVQGANFTVPFTMPLGARTSVRAHAGIPTSGFQPTGALGLEVDLYPRRFGLEGYSRLESANQLEAVNGMFTSLTAALTGYDDGEYYLASGARLWMETGDGPLQSSFSLFAEDQREVRKTVTWSLFEPDSADAAPANLAIDQGVYYGVRTRVSLQLGDDPRRGVFVTRLYGQAAVGDRSFVSVGTTTDLVGPIPGPFVGGLRVRAGLANRGAPGQARYYLGGYGSIRGYPSSAASGASTLVLTGEVGTDVPLVRLVAFGEVGWADEIGSFFRNRPLSAVGGGLSLGDGIFRIDIARGLTAGGVWRVHLATSGLL